MGIQDYYFYSYADYSLGGGGVEARTYLVLIKFNSTLTEFSYRSEHYSNHTGTATTDGIEYANLEIFINDVSVVAKNYNSNGPPDPYSSYVHQGTYTCTGPTCPTANKVRVVASTRAGANTRTYEVTSQLDETYYLTTASSALTVIKTTPNNLNIILPPATTSNSISKIIKRITSSNYAIISTYDGENLDGSFRKAVYLNQYDCGTFICANNEWLIANCYNNNINSTTAPFPTNPNKYSTCTSNKINIFSVNLNAARQSGDNGVILPPAESGKMCIVVYAGDASQKSATNVLMLISNNSNGIDNRFNNTNNIPYVFTDANPKSSGVVLISDGTYWYIVGWNQTSGQAWLSSDPTSSQVITASTYTNFYYLNTSPLNVSANYTVPQTNIANPNDGYFLIFKNRNITGGNGIVLYSNPPSPSTSKYFNEAALGIQNVFAGVNDYGCIWVVSEVRGSTLHWYPIINLQP